MNDRKIIVVAKCFDSNISGPSNIIRNLIKGFEIENIPYEAVLLKEGVSKKTFISQLIHVLNSKDEELINVHTDGFFIPLLVYILSFLYRRHSYYLTVHGFYQIDSTTNGATQKKYVVIEKFLYRHFPNLICVSEMLKNDILINFKRKGNIYVIPNGTDAESNEEYISTDIFEIISLGGLRKVKGIDNTIKMAEKIKELSLNWHISIYGTTDSNEEWFENKIIEDNLTDIIEYKGILSNKQVVYDTIKKADLQLCLSTYDSFNVAIIESLVLGCPCITTKKNGASYLIDDGLNGIVIDAEDKEQNINDKIKKYISSLNREKRMIITEKAKSYKNKFSWSNIAQSYARLQ